MGQQAGSMKRSTALIRPSRAATQHSFTWRSHRIGTACAATRGSRNACDQWRFLRSPMTTSPWGCEEGGFGHELIRRDATQPRLVFRGDVALSDPCLWATTALLRFRHWDRFEPHLADQRNEAGVCAHDVEPGTGIHPSGILV